MQITVLSFYDRISLFQTLKPLLFYKDKGLFHFTSSIDYCLKEDRNKVLFMFRWFLKPDFVDLDQMKILRQKYDRIFFFNGNAGGGIPRLELLDYVDYFFSKALFRDRNLYNKPLYGDELYNQYYHEQFPEIPYKNQRERTLCGDTEKLNKLKLFWNIGIGDFPKKQLRQRAAVYLARKSGKAGIVRPFHLNLKLSSQCPKNKTLPVSARLRPFDDPFLNIHRRLFDEAMAGNPLFLTGSIPQEQYNTETAQASMVLSPFGWGELCFRDFEAVNQGALLLKPDVSHLETWPDIFEAGETYIPLKWDASDLVEKADEFWKNTGRREQIAEQAYQRYREQLNHTEEKLDEILDLLN